jgi:hypothetical protein
MTDFDPNAMRLRLAIDLREIETLALELHTQALASPNARDFPGGTALHMLGPAASIAEWEAQYEAVEEAERWDDDGSDRWAKRPKLDPAMYQGDDNEQPLNVLESWSRIWREEFDQPTSLKATISREVDYLRKVIDRVCEENEYREPAHPAVFEMAAELKQLRKRMEDVTFRGDRPTISRVTCTNTACDAKPRLIRDNGRNDHKCPACKTPYNAAQFALARANNLRSQGADRFVLVPDAIEASGVPKQTMHSWMRRLDIKVACDLKTKKLQVWWPDVRQRTLLWATRRRAS